MSDPTTTNPTATKINADILTAVNAAEIGVETLIVADIAAMGTVANFFTPILKPIINAVISYVGDKFAIVLQNGATFLVIDNQVGNEETALITTRAALIAAEKSGDPNAFKIALQNYANAQSALVHDDGSAPANNTK